jgi:hypothetical protein
MQTMTELLWLASQQNPAPRTGEMQLLPRDAQRTLSRRMENADHAMREIFYSFGFAAHEHIAWAEKFLENPFEERFEQLIANSQMWSRDQYLESLPDLVRQVLALDQKAALAYRKWRQTHGELRSAEY